MANRESWEQRVAAWRASGVTAAEFCAREGLGRRALSRWSQRLLSEATPAVPPVRLARLLRTATPASVTASAPSGPSVAADPALVIEIGGARVTVGRDADLAMVVTVLSMVGAGGGR